MPLPSHPLALSPAIKRKLIAGGTVREKITFEPRAERERRELATREQYRSQPVVKRYNKLYSAFRRNHGRTPGPVEVKEIWEAARKAAAVKGSRDK